MRDDISRVHSMADGTTRLIEVRQIKSREAWLDWRKQDVTASDAACLFGDIHPYQTAYKLWAEKSGLLKDGAADTAVLRRGRLLEPVAIEMLNQDFPGWSVRPNYFYFRDPKARIGATLDVWGRRPDMEGDGIVQIKTVGHFAFKKAWIDQDTGEVEVPLWVAIQASIEAHLADAPWAAVAPLSLGDGGLSINLYDIPLMPKLIDKLIGLVEEFWRRVKEKDPYPIDWGRDVRTVLMVNAEADGLQVDLSGAPDREYLDEIIFGRSYLKDIEKDGEAAEKSRRLVDAELIARLGNAASALVGSTTITAKVVRRKGYTVEPSQYRQVRIKG